GGSFYRPGTSSTWICDALAWATVPLPPCFSPSSDPPTGRKQFFWEGGGPKSWIRERQVSKAGNCQLMPRRISFELRVPTRPEWLTLALDNFDAVLVDHAHCEKKAAANALSLLQAYPEIPGLPLQMAKLAREE